MEYFVGLVSLLFLQVYVYSFSYYITLAIVRTKLKRDTMDKRKGFIYLSMLYLVSTGSFILVALGIYRPVYLLAVIVLVIGGGLWFSKD